MQAFDACVTLANTGNSQVVMTLLAEFDDDVVAEVSPGETATACQGSLQRAHVTCAAKPGSQCGYSWRVDLVSSF
jgi:hypothetical protein